MLFISLEHLPEDAGFANKNADYIKYHLMTAVRRIGVEHVSAATTDSASNGKGGLQLLVREPEVRGRISARPFTPIMSRDQHGINLESKTIARDPKRRAPGSIFDGVGHPVLPISGASLGLSDPFP